MLASETPQWRRRVFAFTWAKVEFVRRHHCEPPNAACKRIARQGLGFSLLESNDPDGPLYTIVWEDGCRTRHYRRGLKWVYAACMQHAGARDGDGLYSLYIAAKRKRRLDKQLKDDSGFLLEVLNNGRREGDLEDAMAPLEQLRQQWHGRTP